MPGETIPSHSFLSPGSLNLANLAGFSVPDAPRFPLLSRTVRNYSGSSLRTDPKDEELCAQRANQQDAA
jgi:hypothetical protein